MPRVSFPRYAGKKMQGGTVINIPQEWTVIIILPGSGGGRTDFSDRMEFKEIG